MRIPPTVLAAALTVGLVSCAPILQPPAPASPFPEAPADSPSPTDTWNVRDLLAVSDLASLRDVGLLIPVRGMSLAKIDDSFDAARDNGRRHDAVDILSARGTPVIAAVDGVILRIGTNALGGNVVWTADTEMRFVHYYAHLDRYARGLKTGAKIERGAVLGYVGTTGNAPADVPHLHFQVLRVTDAKRWWDGTPVNPYPFLYESGAAAGAFTQRSP